MFKNILKLWKTKKFQHCRRSRDRANTPVTDASEPIIMRILIYLIIIAESLKKGSSSYTSFSSKNLRSVCYIKEVLANVKHNPNQLTIDKENNVLYFSFDTGHGQFMPMLLDLESKQLRILMGVRDAFSMSNDEKTGATFFGGSQGIYKYAYKEKKLFRLGVSNLDVWWLFVKKHIYFIQFPSLNAYVYTERRITPLAVLNKTIVHQFVIDHDDNMYFVNGTGLFGIKNGSHEHVLLRDIPAFFGMAVDNTGQVYMSSEDGIYVVSKMTPKVKHIVGVSNVQAITFDKNNHLIYSDSTELVRLIAVTADEYYKNLHKAGLSVAFGICK